MNFRNEQNFISHKQFLKNIPHYENQDIRYQVRDINLIQRLRVTLTTLTYGLLVQINPQHQPSMCRQAKPAVVQVNV